MEHEEKLAFWINVHNTLVMHVCPSPLPRIIEFDIFKILHLILLISLITHFQFSAHDMLQAFLAYGLHQNYIRSTSSIMKVASWHQYSHVAFHFNLKLEYPSFSLIVLIQAAYNVGGTSVSAHVIQRSILGCQPHRHELVWYIHHFFLDAFIFAIIWAGFHAPDKRGPLKGHVGEAKSHFPASFSYPRLTRPGRPPPCSTIDWVHVRPSEFCFEVQAGQGSTDYRKYLWVQNFGNYIHKEKFRRHFHVLSRRNNDFIHFCRKNIKNTSWWLNVSKINSLKMPPLSLN